MFLGHTRDATIGQRNADEQDRVGGDAETTAAANDGLDEVLVALHDHGRMQAGHLPGQDRCVAGCGSGNVPARSTGLTRSHTGEMRVGGSRSFDRACLLLGIQNFSSWTRVADLGPRRCE